MWHGTFHDLIEMLSLGLEFNDTRCQPISSPHNPRLVDLAPSNRQALVMLPETDSDVQRQSWLVFFGYMGWVVDSGQQAIAREFSYLQPLAGHVLLMGNPYVS